MLSRNTQGTMSWDKTGTNAIVYMVLDVNGTQTWEAGGGYASFVRNLYVDDKTQKRRCLAAPWYLT